MEKKRELIHSMGILITRNFIQVTHTQWRPHRGISAVLLAAVPSHLFPTEKESHNILVKEEWGRILWILTGLSIVPRLFFIY